MKYIDPQTLQKNNEVSLNLQSLMHSRKFGKLQADKICDETDQSLKEFVKSLAIQQARVDHAAGVK